MSERQGADLPIDAQSQAKGWFKAVVRSRLFPALQAPCLALLLALFCLELVSIAYGQAPWTVLASLWQGTWGTGYGLGQVLFKATPLIFTGLSVGIAFRAGLFNIGAEGQAALGALATGVVGSSLPSGSPAVVAIPLCILAGALAGGGWGAIPGVLRARFGAHEVISTIMLNFIALAFSSWLVVTHLGIPETVHIAPIIENARLARLDSTFSSLRGAPVNLALLLALGMAGFSAWFLFRTPLGYGLRALGESPAAAEYGGIPVARMTVLAMALSGGMAGLVGTNFVMGYKYYHEEGFVGGVGFLGIAVALLGRSHPWGIVAAALLFGTLSQGGLAVNALIPRDTMEILQAVIILAVAAAGGLRLKSRGGP